MIFPKQSEALTVENARSITDGSSDAIQAFSFLKYAFSFDHIFQLDLNQDCTEASTYTVFLIYPISVSPFWRGGNAHYL